MSWVGRTFDGELFADENLSLTMGDSPRGRVGHPKNSAPQTDKYMSKSLEQLQPAPTKDVNIYVPYYRDQQQREMLPLAISLYQQGNFEGQRMIEEKEGIPFIATWNISNLPADLSRCTVQFENNADLSYEITIINFEFIGHLLEVLKSHRRSRIADFSKPFYRKLLGLDE
jgi:hypothetical protein